MAKDAFTTIADLLRESVQLTMERELLKAVDQAEGKAKEAIEQEFINARRRARTEAQQAAVVILQKATEAGIVVDLRLRP